MDQNPMDGWAKDEFHFIVSELLGWRKKDGTKRFKKAFLDRKFVSDLRLLSFIIVGMETDDELKDKWNFLFLPNERTIKRLWKQFGKYDFRSMNISQIQPIEIYDRSMMLGRLYFQNTRTVSKLGIVREQDLETLIKKRLTDNSGYVAFSQAHLFKNLDNVQKSFESPNLLIMTMTHDSKRHSIHTHKFLKEPVEKLVNDSIEDDTFVFMGGHGYR